jgi:hypothetical protein
METEKFPLDENVNVLEEEFDEDDPERYIVFYER